jgi:hypothetical protein
VRCVSLSGVARRRGRYKSRRGTSKTRSKCSSSLHRPPPPRVRAGRPDRSADSLSVIKAPMRKQGDNAAASSAPATPPARPEKTGGREDRPPASARTLLSTNRDYSRFTGSVPSRLYNDMKTVGSMSLVI